MRYSNRRSRAVQLLLAFIMLAPLLAAFWRLGGLNATVETGTGDAAARFWTLMHAAMQSFCVATVSMGVAALIGIPAAWALARRPASAFLTALLVLPLALPAPVAVSGWVRLIAPSAASSFALTPAGAVPGIASAVRAMLFSSTGAGLILGFCLWPVIALNLWPALGRARDASYESAQLLASPWRVYFYTILPRCKGELVAGIALVFLLAGNDFAVPSLLLVNTLTVEVHDLAALRKNVAAAWAALPLILVAALMCVAFIKSSSSKIAPAHVARAAEARGFDFASLVLYAGVVMGFALPIISCMTGIIANGKPLSASFDAGAGALTLSVRLAAAAALLGCAVAVGRLLIWPEMRVPALNTAGVLLLAIPGSFIGIALLTLQIHANEMFPLFQQPLAWLALGLALRFSYIPLRLIEEAVSGIDSSLLESAALLGQSRLARAVSVVFPLSLGHLAAAAVLIFTLAMGEVPIAAILAPPGEVPATIWLFGQQHMGYDESVFALSLLLGAATAAAIAVGALAAKRISM